MRSSWVHQFRRHCGEDRGTASVELVALTIPACLIVTLLIAFSYKVAATDIDVRSAAASAARAASFARTPSAARTDARTAAAADLAAHHINCAILTVTVDTGQFRRGGTVAVNVDCAMSTAGLTGLHLPVTIHRSATATAVIDTYRHLDTGGDHG